MRVKRTKLLLFVLSGVVSAAVGLLYAFELYSAGENIGIGFELQVITIVLLGGVLEYSAVRERSWALLSPRSFTPACAAHCY